MNYIELVVHINPDFTEILIAELAEIHYESFVETDEGLNAYIPETSFDPDLLREVISKYENQTTIAFFTNTLEKKNWNEEWESNYEPIEVNGLIRVRASFHAPDPGFRYDLLINPKMSFGTGHHETTWLVMNEQLQLEHTNCSLMDVGCGTGILAILGRKLGAGAVTAFDIEEWAVENARENFGLNGVLTDAEIFQGTIESVAPDKQFDGILANINRNILLAEIPSYNRHLKPGGWLVVSGFYQSDAGDISKLAALQGLSPLRSNVRNNWAVLVFTKNNTEETPK